MVFVDAQSRRVDKKPDPLKPQKGTNQATSGSFSCIPWIVFYFQGTGIRACRRMHLIIQRRLSTQQITDKVVPAAARHIVAGRAVSMPLIGKHQQIEILVRLDQRVDDQQRVVRRHVVVHRAVRQQQMSLQVLCQVLICLVVIVRPVDQTPDTARPNRLRTRDCRDSLTQRCRP